MESATHGLTDPSPRSRTLRVALWILILLAGTEFLLRGPGRYLPGPGNWNDLSQNYTAARLWLKGQSPADPKNFVALWRQQGHARLDVDDIRTHLSPPLGGLVVLAPVAALPWRAAKITWLGILLFSFAATVYALASTSGFRWNENRTLAFLAACLALAPFQTGIASGNTSILVIGLCAIAIWAARANSDIAAGILFGVACAVKPQLGAFLVLYYLVRQRWKLFSTAVGCTLALNLVAVAYLQLRGAPWVQDYLHNIRGFVTSNHIDDFTSANPSRFTLINLQVPFFSITGASSSANVLALAVVTVLVLVWIYWVIRKNGQPELLGLGAISALALLPVYHRFYDAGLLAVPLCWCIAGAMGPIKSIARLALVLMAPFAVPGTAFLQQLAVHGHVSDAVTNSWLWNVIVMPHQTWLLLLLFLVLLYGLSSGRAKSESQGKDQLQNHDRSLA
jgi:Glycosyltransferase family 87